MSNVEIPAPVGAVKPDEREPTPAFESKSTTLEDLIARASWEANNLWSAADDFEAALDAIIDDEDTPDHVRDAAENVRAELGRDMLDRYVDMVEELEALVDQD
jgi:hypothetical protein